jgi:hypothetical protein
VRDLFSTGEPKERRGHEQPDLQSRAGPTANRRCSYERRNERRVRGEIVCVLALILLFLTVGVGVRSYSDINTAEARVAPTGIVAPTIATLSPDTNAYGGNEDVAQVTSRARFKVH